MTAALQPQSAAPAEHPIIFSGPMVRAILAGTKSQTRRVIKAPPKSFPGADLEKAFADKAYGVTPCLQVPCADGSVQRLRNPWGFPNSVADSGGVVVAPTHLWVRETWQLPWVGATQMFPPSPKSAVMYERFARTVGQQGQHPMVVHAATWDGPRPRAWRPSIHMPRWASRIMLEVIDVRAERLRDITEEDALAEGIPAGSFSVRSQFAELWDSINGDRDRADWAANPWVWVVQFRKVS